MLSLLLFGAIGSAQTTCTPLKKPLLYKVQNGDQMATILQKFSVTPLWGKKRAVDKTTQLNQKSISDPNKIFIGQIIVVPIFCEEQLAHNEPQTIQEITTFVAPQPMVAPAAPVPVGARAPSSENIDVVPLLQIAAEQPVVLSPLARTPAVSPVASPVACAPAAAAIPPFIAAAPKAVDEEQSRLVFSIGPGYSRIDSKYAVNGAQAVLLSKVITSESLGWEQIWSNTFESFINFGYSQTNFQDANNGTLNSNSQSTTSLAVGGTYQWTDSLKLGFSLGEQGELFAPSYASGQATLEEKDISFAKVFVMKDLYKVKALKLSTILGASYLAPASGSNYDISAGQQYDVSIRATQKFKNFSFYAEAQYSYLIENTSIANEQRKDINGRIGFIVPLYSGGDL